MRVTVTLISYYIAFEPTLRLIGIYRNVGQSSPG